MDEPTNDLDLETLEILEDKLVNYQGTLLLVSHDRTFLDNVVTSVLVFEGEGTVNEYIGGYADWARLTEKKKQDAAAVKAAQTVKKDKTKDNKPAKKLGYKQQRELEQLPNLIDQLETRQGELNEQINHVDFYKQAPEATGETLAELEKVEQELDQAFSRWEELDALHQ